MRDDNLSDEAQPAMARQAAAIVAQDAARPPLTDETVPMRPQILDPTTPLYQAIGRRNEAATYPGIR